MIRRVFTASQRLCLSFTKILYIIGSAFKDAFQTRATFLLLFYIATAFPLGLLLWPLSSERIDQYNDLLLSMVEIVGGIIAFIISATLIVAELASRYAPRILHQLIGPWTLLYFIPFFSVLFYNIYLSSITPTLSQIKIAFLFNGLCLTLLIPYFFISRKRVKIDYVIMNIIKSSLNLITKASVAQKNGCSREIKECLSELEGIAMEALTRHDYPTFRDAISGIKSIGLSALKYHALNEDEFIEAVIVSLGCIARETLAHPRAPFEIVSILKELAITTAVPEWETIAKRSILTIGKIAKDGLREKRNDIAEWSFGALGLIGADIILMRAFWAPVRTIIDIFYTTVETAHKRDEELAEEILVRIIQSLRSVVNALLEKEQNRFKLTKRLDVALRILTKCAQSDVIYAQDETLKNLAQGINEIIEGSVEKQLYTIAIKALEILISLCVKLEVHEERVEPVQAILWNLEKSFDIICKKGGELMIKKVPLERFESKLDELKDIEETQENFLYLLQHMGPYLDIEKKNKWLTYTLERWESAKKSNNDDIQKAALVAMQGLYDPCVREELLKRIFDAVEDVLSNKSKPPLINTAFYLLGIILDNPPDP